METREALEGILAGLPEEEPVSTNLKQLTIILYTLSRKYPDFLDQTEFSKQYPPVSYEINSAFMQLEDEKLIKNMGDYYWIDPVIRNREKAADFSEISEEFKKELHMTSVVDSESMRYYISYENTRKVLLEKQKEGTLKEDDEKSFFNLVEKYLDFWRRTGDNTTKTPEGELEIDYKIRLFKNKLLSFISENDFTWLNQHYTELHELRVGD